jgi:hypothetical protein
MGEEKAVRQEAAHGTLKAYGPGSSLGSAIYELGACDQVA